MRSPFLFFLVCICFVSLSSQNRKIDSLKKLLWGNNYFVSHPTKGSDTLNCTYLNKLSEAFFIEGVYDTALYYCNKALETAQKISAAADKTLARSGKRACAKSYNAIGFVSYNLGEFNDAIKNYELALKINEQLNDKKGMSTNLGNMGSTYEEKGDFQNALLCYFRTIKIDAELGDQMELGRDYGNVGNVYANQGDYAQSLEYYFKSLKIDEESSRSADPDVALVGKRGVAAELSNIGNVYLMQGDNQRALAHLFKALKISEETEYDRLKTNILGNIGSAYFDKKEYNNALNYYKKALNENQVLGNKNGIANYLLNIGNVYHQSAKNWGRAPTDTLFEKALEYFKASLKISEEQGYPAFQASALGNMGDIYCTKKQYRNAFENMFRAMAISIEIGAVNDVKERYMELAELYERSNVSLPDTIGGKNLNPEQMRLKSIYFFKKHAHLKDKLFNEESKRQSVRKQMNYEFEKKELFNRTIHEKQMAVAEADKKRQQIFIMLIAVVALAVALIAIVVFRSLNVVKKQKVIIERQKEMVEEKQKEILDSINYAKRIQQSLLPSEKMIERILQSKN